MEFLAESDPSDAWLYGSGFGELHPQLLQDVTSLRFGLSSCCQIFSVLVAELAIIKYCSVNITVFNDIQKAQKGPRVVKVEENGLQSQISIFKKCNLMYII